MFFLSILLYPYNNLFSQERTVIDLSSQEWQIRLDKEAEWNDDELFLPPVKLDNIHTNPPTGG